MTEAQFAINSISTSGGSLEERLDAYAAAGFRNVEFMLGHVKGTPGARRMLDERGLLCVGGFETHLCVFGDAEARAANHALMVENARLLQELGGTTLVVGTDGPKNIREGDPLGEIAAVAGEVAGRIAPFGVELLFEFNWSPVVKSVSAATQVARRARAANVGVLFDPAHYHCTPSKLEQLTPETVGLIRHVHVDDMRDKPGELSDCNADRELPGEGCLDLRGIFGRIEALGYRGFFSIEMFSEDLWALPARDAAARMYASMRTLLD